MKAMSLHLEQLAMNPRMLPMITVAKKQRVHIWVYQDGQFNQSTLPTP